ncbi:MAG: prolyl oligopeptidase family serine peptidase [Xanthomonadales bacterium]|jgi:dienelactone hydrolase|nr:prolyl oligopeptidase family serine peptidase [Xanthomonadales bacterium]
MKRPFSLAGISFLALTLFFAANCFAEPYLDEGTLKKYLEPRDYWNVRLSPDGRHVSVLTKKDDRNTLVVLDLETMKPTASVRYEESRDIEVNGAEWVNSDLLYYSVSRKVASLETPLQYPELFLLAADGSRNDRVWSTHGNYENNARRKGELTRGHPRVVNVLPGDRHRILMLVLSFERRDGAGLGKLVKMDVRNGDTRQLDNVPEYTERVLSSKDARTLLASTLDRDYRRGLLLSVNGGKSWTPLPFDMAGYVDGPDPLAVEDDSVYLLAQRSGAIDAPSHVLRYRIGAGRWEVAYDIGFSSLGGIDVNSEGELTRVQWVDDRPRIEVLDPDDRVSRVLQSFAKSYAGFAVEAVSQTEDKNMLLVYVGSGAYMGEYFLYDAQTRKARFLVSMDEDLDGAQLADLQDARFTASDGVVIPGWFQPPPGVGKPPLVVDIHGGPHGPYHAFGFNASWHLLNAMGYAVYAPNFRGSGGYGRGFERAGFGKWGTRMLDDVAEGARHLVDRGLVDGGRVCVYGGSYGGYGSAQSLVRHNDLYRCGVIIAGVFDLEKQKARTDTRGWYAGGDYMDMAIGDDEEQLREMSPIYHVDEIRAPMLILHGEEDERTPFKGAEEFVEVLEKAGKDMDYRWYPDEGHGNALLENRIDEWQRIERFLRQENGPVSE